MAFLGAQTKFRLFNPSGYNIPKPRFLFYVNFVSRFLDPQFLQFTGFFIKTVDRIQMTYDVQELNQYNRKRLVQTKVNYGPLNFSMYDVVDNYALKLIEAYNRFYFGDFTDKNNNSWNYDLVTNNFEFTNNWGLKADQTSNDSYFFDRIEIYEIYDQTFTQINFINPKITSVDFQAGDVESSEGQTVSMSCKYEGIVVENVNAIMTPALADKFGIPFRSDFGLPTGAYRIPGVANLITSATGLLSNVLTSFGVGNFAAGNISNALVTEGISRLRPKVLTAFGSGTFDNIERTGEFLNNVQLRSGSGDIVRDVSTGAFSRKASNLFI